MAFGFFNVVEPGLTYVGRASYRANSGLSTDPIDADAVQAGELLSLNANQELIRPIDNGGAIDPGAVLLPCLVDKSRTDVQSTNSGPGSKLTVLVHIGALCITSQFATKTGAGADIPTTSPGGYAVGAQLVPCLFNADDTGNVLLSGLCPLGVAAGASTDKGAVRSVGGATATIATLMRQPYAISGVGVTAGRGFPAPAAPDLSDKVIDILITGATS